MNANKQHTMPHRTGDLDDSNDEWCVKNQHEFGIVKRGMSLNENTSNIPEVGSIVPTCWIKDHFVTVLDSICTKCMCMLIRLFGFSWHFQIFFTIICQQILLLKLTFSCKDPSKICQNQVALLRHSIFNWSPDRWIRFDDRKNQLKRICIPALQQIKLSSHLLDANVHVCEMNKNYGPLFPRHFKIQKKKNIGLPRAYRHSATAAIQWFVAFIEWSAHCALCTWCACAYFFKENRQCSP